MRTIGFLSALVLVGAAPVLAQGNGRSSDRVPPGHMPPPGMCRIWIDGVPPGRQPAPTDCSTAVARRPANARVIFGGEGRNRRDEGRYENCELVGRQQSTVLGLPIPTGRVDEDARRRCEERNRRLDRTRNDGRDDDDDRWDRDDDSDDRRRPRYERKDDDERRALEARRDAKDRMLRNDKVKKEKKEKERKIKNRDRDRDDD